MTKRFFIIFVSAFILNLVWEHFHSVLYISYKGEAITNLILLRAALFDAVVIALFSFPLLFVERLKQKRRLLYFALVIFAILLEKWALLTGRWAYAETMPIIPFLDVGLTPAIQLGVLGCVAVWIADFYSKKTASRESVF